MYFLFTSQHSTWSNRGGRIELQDFEEISPIRGRWNKWGQVLILTISPGVHTNGNYFFFFWSAKLAATDKKIPYEIHFFTLVHYKKINRPYSRADRFQPLPGLNRFKPWFKPAGINQFKHSLMFFITNQVKNHFCITFSCSSCQFLFWCFLG